MIDKKLNLFLLILQALCMAGISLLLVSLTLEAIEGPCTSYRGVTVLTPEVPPGGLFEVRVEYEKFHECGGTAIVTFTEDRTGESKIVQTSPLGDRSPGVFSVVRQYRVPATALGGPGRFMETLNYYRTSGISVVRSPPMPLTVQ